MYQKLLSAFRRGGPCSTKTTRYWNIQSAANTTSKRVIAIAMALTFAASIFTAAPASAWGPISGRWPPNVAITLCKGTGWDSVTSVAWNTVHTAVFRWNNYNYGQPKFVDPTGPMDICEYIVSLNMTDGPPAQSATSYNAGYIAHVDTRFNYAARNRYWWYGSNQDCYVGVGNGCMMDAFTIAMHEAGHALGLTHNTRPEGDQRCVTGYYSTNSAAACDYYGEAVMHWNSGVEWENNALGYGYIHQGYRHLYPTADDLGALNQY